MIDLTANSQLPCDHTSQSVPSSRSESPDDNGRVSCPMCGQRFPSSVIQLHAEQCEGPEPDRSHRRGEDITHYATTSVAKSNRGLSMQRRGRRGRKSYQPSLIQLVNKDSAMTREDDIDSNSTSGE